MVPIRKTISLYVEKTQFAVPAVCAEIDTPLPKSNAPRLKMPRPNRVADKAVFKRRMEFF